jgi:hypothetical protein
MSYATRICAAETEKMADAHKILTMVSFQRNGTQRDLIYGDLAIRSCIAWSYVQVLLICLGCCELLIMCMDKPIFAEARCRGKQ